MKKIINISKIMIFASILVLLNLSCENDDNTGKAPLNIATDVEASITLSNPLLINQTVREADANSYQYEITLNKPQVVPVKIYIDQISGNADEDDIDFDHEVLFAPYQTKAKGNISIKNDNELEGDVTAVIQIGNIKTANASIKTPTIVTFKIKDCFSALAGTYAYVTTNCFTPGPPIGNATGPFTGNVTFTATTTSGEYSISDASFGGWLGLYGPQTNTVNNTANGVKLLDLCGKISYTGKDQYDEIFTFSNLVITGNKMKFKWENDYGEKGETELTNPNGNWPVLSL